MLITSNRNISEWGAALSDVVVDTAILDRFLHHSHVLTIRSDRYGLRASSGCRLTSGGPNVSSG